MKNNMGVNFNRPKKIKELNYEGKIKKIYKSIHSFRKQKNIYAICDENLKKLDDGKVIKIKKSYICLISTRHTKAFNELKNAEKLKKEHNEILEIKKKGLCRPDNLNNSIYKLSRSIIVMDGVFNIVGIHNETMIELSKIFNVPVGTIKASCNKTRKKIKQYLNENKNSKPHNGYYFIHLKDLIENI